MGKVSPPLPPTNLIGTSSASQVNLSWDVSSGATSYSIFKSLVSGGILGYSNIGTVTTTNYIDTDVISGIEYFYVVTSIGINSSGLFSSEVNATPS